MKLTNILYILSAIGWKEIEGLKRGNYAYWGYLWHLTFYKVFRCIKILFWFIWHLTVTLTLSWHMGNMGSAHPLVEVNVSFKFEGNPSISKGAIVKSGHKLETDRRTDRPTRQSKSSIVPHISWWGYNKHLNVWNNAVKMMLKFNCITFCWDII